MKWTTQLGKEIEICEMTTDHIINTLNLIEKSLCVARNNSYESDGEIFIPEELKAQIFEMYEVLEARGISIDY